MQKSHTRTAHSAFALLCLLFISGCDWFKDDRPLYQRIPTPAAPVLTPTLALSSFDIAPGFNIELVASEPMIEDPVAMAWDAQGRLFVVEMRGFMPNLDGLGEDQPVGRVVLLEDSDNDGRMDSSRVFADKLVLPRAIAVTNAGLLIGEPPHLWLCPDIAGKSQCENRRLVGQYAPEYQKSNMEHLENGLMPGIDNWLYNAMSGRRMRILNGEIEVQQTLQRGQWGIAKDDEGRLYYNSNSNFLSGDFFSANPTIDANISGTAGLQETLENGNEVFSIRVNPGVNRAYIDGVLRADGRLKNPTSVSGLAVYRGHQFPESFRQDIFVPEPAANVVAQFRNNKASDFVVATEHITYPDKQWGQKEFLASTDERFRPVDAKVGPDGALYIIDMYRGVIQHSAFLTDELRQQIINRGLDKPIGQGRIWRITSLQNEPQPSVNVAATTHLERIRLLNHPNGWVRDTAQRLLLTTDQGHDELRELILGGTSSRSDVIAAIHAIWILAGRSTLDAGLVVDAVALDARIAKQALQAGGHLLSTSQFISLKTKLPNPPTALRQQLLFSLNAVNSSPQIQAWMLDLYRDTAATEKYIRPALLFAATGVENAILSRVLADATISESAENRALITGLTENFYHSLRVNDPATHAQPLLDLVGKEHHAREWVELAMLSGLSQASTDSNFKPWELPSPPALFNDQSVAGDSPVWEARLSARRAFTWPGDELAAGLTPLTPEQQALEKRGIDFYTHCAGCHGKEGQGTPGLAPELAQSHWVTGPVEWLGRIILDGIQGPIMVNDREWNAVMPGHRHMPGMSEDTLMGLITYLRRSWGNRAAPPTDDQISALLAYNPPNQPWTSSELQSIPYMTGLEKFVGRYKLSFVTFTVSIKDGNLAFDIPMYGTSNLKQTGPETFVVDPEADTTVRFELDASDRAARFILSRGNAENIVERID